MVKNYKPPLEPYLDVVFEGDDFLVLNKPSGLLSVPGRQAIHQDSLQLRAQKHYPTATTVHRLDMETSGLIVMALNKASHIHLSRQFENRQVKKQYIARIYGHLPVETGQVDVPLICDWPNRPKQKVDLEQGKKALTLWHVKARETDTTLLNLFPVTGRSHQLRVHMLHLGYPIVGDQLYASGSALSYSDRLQLHSQVLSFKLLNSAELMRFEVAADF